MPKVKRTTKTKAGKAFLEQQKTIETLRDSYVDRYVVKKRIGKQTPDGIKVEERDNG